MHISLRKISDEQNNLGFEEIVLFGTRLAAVYAVPKGKGKALICTHEWIASLDGQVQGISDEELMESLHCYEFVESDTITPATQLCG